MQTTPRIGFWLDNSNQTPQQTVETILVNFRQNVTRVAKTPIFSDPNIFGQGLSTL